MQQALHILRKDIRYLWIEIAAALLAVGLFLFTAARPDIVWNSPLPRTVASFLMQFLLPFAWWTLITRAVHAEPLIGDRQFWPTRPYAWRSLLGAKAMLFVLFINLPMLIAQCIVIQMHGLSTWTELAGLLWNQVLFTVFVILPIAAIAAVTASVVQFLVICLVAFVLVLLFSMRFMLFAAAIVGGGWGPMEWIHATYALLILAIAAPAILIWQYARRRTLLVRVLAAATVVIVVVSAPISWSTAFALQSRFSKRPVAESALHAGFNSSFQWMTRALVERDGRVSLSIPLQVTGAADDVTLHPEGLELAIEGSGGAVWRAPAEWRANVSSTGQLITLQTNVEGSFFQKVKDQPVRIRGYLYTTLYSRHVSTLPFVNRPTPVPGLGICSATARPNAPYFLTCNSALRPLEDFVSVQFEPPQRDALSITPQRQPLTFSPFPAQLSIDPVDSYTAYAFKGRFDAVSITSLEPLTYVRVPLEIDGLRLADYERKI